MKAKSMDDVPLTKKKKEWALQFKPAVLRGKTLNYNYAIAAQYNKGIRALVIQMTSQTAREINLFFKKETSQQFFAQDESISSQARILTNSLQDRFTQLFSRKAKGLAESMVKQSDQASSNALHQSLKDLSGGLSLQTTILTEQLSEVLGASITENVGLIKSIASEYLSDVQGAVMRAITTGNGLQDLIPYLKNKEGVTMRRADLIAHDQTRKAYSSINANRMQALGVDKYEWVASGGGQEPRPLHHQRAPTGLNGSICSLSNPPIIQYAKGKQPEIRGKPGDLVNCRCTMRPIITFSRDEDE